MGQQQRASADDLMTIAEAQQLLGVGNKKIAKLVKEGELSTTPDVLDKRVKLVKRSDVEALKTRSVKSAA